MDNLKISRLKLEESTPLLTGTLILNGLEREVEIYRDKFGIPHVRTSTLNDAFFGQGFATAQDRLWHMDYDRRRAYGQWAEVAGLDAVEQDVFMRRLRLEVSARRDYEAIGLEAKSMLDAYSEGVNSFIETTQVLPIEYRILKTQPDPWQPWDCLSVFKMRHVLMGSVESKLWRAKLLNSIGPEMTARLFPGYKEGHLVIIPPGEVYRRPFDELSTSDDKYSSSDSVKRGLEEFRQRFDSLEWLEEINDKERDSGSNNWVLSGTRTASGKPILAGDPHRTLEVPNVYYQNHVACPQFDTIGLSFPGVPGFPHFGHNEHVAWCVTHTGADCQDLYVEHFKADDPSYYDFRGSWLKSETYSETVKIRDQQSKKITVTVTQHGPIIMGNPENGYGISFKYTGTDGAGLWPETLLAMLKSTSTKELDNSMKDWVDPVNNFLFADVDGRVGYRMRGQLPIRNDSNTWLPVPGWTGEYEWKTMVPFEEMPNIENPEIGYIVTANNRPVGHQFPHYIALDFSPEFRARRLSENILNLQNATIEEMSLMHSDCISIPAKRFLRVLDKVNPKDEMSKQCLALLFDWDGSMHQDRVEPTIYSAFWHSFVRLAVAPLFGIQAESTMSGIGRGAPAHLRSVSLMILNAVEKEDVSLLPQDTDWSSVLNQGLAQAVGWLQETLGNEVETWLWGKLHKTNIIHPLSTVYPEVAPLINPPEVPMNGDGDTPQAASYSQNKLFSVVSSSVARYAFDLADWNRSLWVVPLGVSGNPGSSHYIDQLPFWSRVKMIPMSYNWKEICADAESRQYLKSR